MYRANADEDRSVVVFGLNGRIIALDVSTGSRKFEHQVGRGEVELLIEDERIYAVTADRRLYCFTYPSGRALGSTKLPGTYASRPTMLMDSGRLFICSGGEVVCTNLDGGVLWHDPMTGKGLGSMSIGLPGVTRQADDRD